jgi:hypothetical protein
VIGSDEKSGKLRAEEAVAWLLGLLQLQFFLVDKVSVLLLQDFDYDHLFLVKTVFWRSIFRNVRVYLKLSVLFCYECPRLIHMVQILALKLDLIEFIVKFNQLRIVFAGVTSNRLLFFSENVEYVFGRFNTHYVLSWMVELLDVTIKFHHFSLSESVRINDAYCVIIHAHDQRLAVLGKIDVPDVFNVHQEQ